MTDHWSTQNSEYLVLDTLWSFCEYRSCGEIIDPFVLTAVQYIFAWQYFELNKRIFLAVYCILSMLIDHPIVYTQGSICKKRKFQTNRIDLPRLQSCAYSHHTVVIHNEHLKNYFQNYTCYKLIRSFEQKIHFPSSMYRSIPDPLHQMTSSMYSMLLKPYYRRQSG